MIRMKTSTYNSITCNSVKSSQKEEEEVKRDNGLDVWIRMRGEPKKFVRKNN